MGGGYHSGVAGISLPRYFAFLASNGVCNVVDSDVLHSDASNIAAFLMHMARPHPDHYARIEETVRQVAPFFGALCSGRFHQARPSFCGRIAYLT